MSEKSTGVRSMHDLGLAAWFGGSLMGAVGLNGASAQAQDPTERAKLAAYGWARWTPVNAAAIGLHALGGLGLIGANKSRVATQPGARANTVVKAALTVAAAGLTAYAGYLGRQVDQHAHEGAVGATEPQGDASETLKKAQQQLKVTQWAIPAVTGALVVMGAVQGEQQRPQSLVRNQLDRLPGR
ncbi:hypothetical protein [Nocardioides aequoreus]|uniref:hypothetical protein n=1 Tax=Nocardioides aequoreus TaxID=397278 RepID=UPI0004C3A568|nr:hypothetical protein [Nocardioides aequoreus]